MKKAHISKALFAPPAYAHGVRVLGEEWLFTAGAVPLDKNGKLVGKNDVVLQTGKVCENLEAVMTENGYTLGDIIKTTIYVVSDDASSLAAVWTVLKEKGVARSTAASTLLGVSCLGYAGQLVEVELVAAR